MLVRIACDVKDTLDWRQIKPLQGDYKKATPEQVDKLYRVILKRGIRFPSFVSKVDGEILAIDTHRRLVVYEKLEKDGHEIAGHQVPVVYIHAKDKAEAKQLLLECDSRYGKTDQKGFDDFISDLDADFLSDIEIPDIDIDFMRENDSENETKNDNLVPEIKENAVSQYGEIYELGNSILMCGDSTSLEDIERLMGTDKADMVFTDPPYGVDYNGGVIHGNTINVNHKRDKLINDDNADIYSAFLKNIQSIITNGAIYIFYATKYSYEVIKAVKENSINLMAIIAWVKINTGYADMNSHYKNKYEPCLYCKIGDKTNFIGESNENTVWEIKKDRLNDLHPTQKPVELPYRAIKNHNAEIIADLFGGSGSTLIAAEKLNRKARIMELDPHYCDVIRRRWTKWARENNRPIGSGGLE